MGGGCIRKREGGGTRTSDSIVSICYISNNLLVTSYGAVSYTCLPATVIALCFGLIGAIRSQVVFEKLLESLGNVPVNVLCIQEFTRERGH